MRRKLRIGVVLAATVCGVVLAWHAVKSHSLDSTVIVQPSTLEVRSGADSAPLAFTVINQGNTVVEISDVTATCGCTVVKARQRKLNPHETMQVEVQASPPGIGEKTSRITIHTVPPQPQPLTVLVTLKGEEQAVPIVSYCAELLTLNGSVLGEEVTRQFEVHTIEKIDTKPWLANEQLAVPDLRIWYDEPPAETSFNSGAIRRVYNMKVAVVLRGNDGLVADRYRHTLTALSKSPSPGKTIAIEWRVIPLVRAVPSVLNLTVSSGASNSVERTVVVIDDRAIQSGQPVRSRADHDWLVVKSGKADVQEQRSVHSFQIILDCQKLGMNPRESMTRSVVTFFMDDDETTTVCVPIIVRAE